MYLILLYLLIIRTPTLFFHLDRFPSLSSNSLLPLLDISLNATLRIHIPNLPRSLKMQLALLLSIKILMLIIRKEIGSAQHLQVACIILFICVIIILIQYLLINIRIFSKILFYTLFSIFIISLTIFTLVIRINIIKLIRNMLKILAKNTAFLTMMKIILEESFLRVEFLFCIEWIRFDWFYVTDDAILEVAVSLCHIL